MPRLIKEKSQIEDHANFDKLDSITRRQYTCLWKDNKCTRQQMETPIFE